jgi:hypothetical protein
MDTGFRAIDMSPRREAALFWRFIQRRSTSYGRFGSISDTEFGPEKKLSEFLPKRLSELRPKSVSEMISEISVRITPKSPSD